MARRRASHLLLGALVPIVALAAACTSDDDGGGDDEAEATTTTSPAEAPAVLRLGVTTPLDIDPAVVVPTAHGQMIEADLLYDGLTATDPTVDPVSDEAVVPALAEAWSADDDFTTWTFTLRDDAMFSDGEPVTADDVKASFERIAAQGTDSLGGVRLEVIDGYEAFVAGDADEITGLAVGDDGEVVITTTESFAPLPELLASPVFGVTPAAVDGEDVGLVTSGPFVRADAEVEEAAAAELPEGADEVAVLQAVDGADVGVDEVRLVHFATLDDAYQAFVDGELDWTLVPGDEVAEAREEFGDGAFTPFHAEFFLGIDVTDEAFADQAFREALVRAVDRQAIVEELYPEGVFLNGTVASGVPGHQDDPCGDTCAYDPEVAEELVADAFPDGEVPTVTIDFFEGEREEALATAVADDLEAVGIPTELGPQPAEDYKGFVTSGDQQVFLFGWVGIAPSADSYLAPLFLTGSPDNVTAFSSEAVDAGIAAARAFADPAERAEAYQRVEEAVMAQVPVLPLVQVSTVAVVSDRVQGWAPRLDGTFVVADVQVGE